VDFTRERTIHALVGHAALWLALILAVAVAVPTAAVAEEKKCECNFADSKWEAFGSKALCTAYTRKSRTSCEIEFGGLSADKNMITDLLGLDQATYQREVYEVLATYIEYLAGNKLDQLANAKFLSRAMPIFMRGAYLRKPLDQRLPDGTLRTDYIRSLDRSIKDFFDKYSERVARVFLGKSDEFSTEVGGVKFHVGRGYLLLDLDDGHLYSRYMPE
jgi:hypothetical protein